MIRIYLDWNVISNLKRPESKELKDFIDKHKKYFLFPYSPAHFSDFMKSYSSENQLFIQDLDMLEYLSEKHLILWNGKQTDALFETPKQYFEREKDKEYIEDVFSLMDMEENFAILDEMDEDFGIGKFGTLSKLFFKMQPLGIEINDDNREILQKMFPDITSNSSMWDLMKDLSPFSKNFLTNKEYYKDFRKSIGDKGVKVDKNSGNWEEQEVIDNIDKFLKGLGTETTFTEFIELTFKHRKEPVNIFEFFMSAYLMLDMIGYKPDKLPKPTDNMQNIQKDAEHAFYAAHCDYFIVGDEKLRIKSKALYNKFNISSVVLRPHEMIEELEKVIYAFPENGDFIEEALGFVNKNEIVKSYSNSEDNGADIHLVKLNGFYFNFFNYLVHRYYPSENGYVLTFIRAFENYSNFIYYTEIERLIDRVVDEFGFDDKEELMKIKKELVYEDKGYEIIWDFEGGIIRIEKDENTKRLTLSYFIAVNERGEKEGNNY